MSSPAVEVKSVTKRFPGVTALQNVSFSVSRGAFHSIVGENGAGKSTLMKVLAGVLTEYDGELLVGGRAVRFTGTRDAEAAGVSIIHQELNLVEELSAAANIFLGREKRRRFGRLDDRRMEQEAAALFRELDCDIPPRRLVSELRVGDQQLVEIAKALSLDTGILIMDEPTSALTKVETERLFRVIETLTKRGTTILYISHKLEEVFRRSDRISVLRDGALVRTMDRTETNRQEVTCLMVGREIESVPKQAERTASELLLEVNNLSLPWPGHAREWRLQNISFTLRRSEVVGIAGLMGSGRTELLECLFGATRPDPVGEIRLQGRPVSFSGPRQALMSGVALVTEDRKRLGLFDQMNVRENISVCTLDRVSQNGLINMRREREMAANSIRQLSIRTDSMDAAVTSLSGGNQQKCIIARWLATDPDVLLLDDPTRGIDVGAKAEVYRLIDEQCRKGLGIIVTSGELEELITLCDRILVLAAGRVTGELDRSGFSERRIMELATSSVA